MKGTEVGGGDVLLIWDGIVGMADARLIERL